MKTSKIFLLYASLASAIADPSSGQACETPVVAQALMRWDPLGEGKFELSVERKALDELSEIGDSEVAIVSMTGPDSMRKNSVIEDLALEFTNDGKFKNDIDDKDALDMLIIPGCKKPLGDERTTTLVLIDSFGPSATSRTDAQDGQLLAVLNMISSVVLYQPPEGMKSTDWTLLRSAMHAAGLLGDLRGCGMLQSGYNDEEHIKGDGDEEDQGDNPAGDDGTHESGGEARAISHPTLRWLVQKPMVTEENPDTALDRVGSFRDEYEALNKFYGEKKGFFLPYPPPDGDPREFTNAVKELKESIVEDCSKKLVENSLVKGTSLVADLEGLMEDLALFKDASWEAAFETKFKEALQTPVENKGDQGQARRRNHKQVMEILRIWEARWDVAETLSGGSGEPTGDKRRENVDHSVREFLKESFVKAKEEAENNFQDDVSEAASTAAQGAEDHVKDMCGELWAEVAAVEMEWKTRVDKYRADVDKPGTGDDSQPGAGDGEKPKTEDESQKGPDEVLQSPLTMTGANDEGSSKKVGEPAMGGTKQPDSKEDAKDIKDAKAAIDDVMKKLDNNFDPGLSKLETLNHITQAIFQPVKSMGLSEQDENQANKYAQKKAKELHDSAWETKCEKIIDKYRSKIKAAWSLFSLAPMLHSRMPRFMDEGCLEHIKSRMELQVEKLEENYHKNTLGRRWLVRLLDFLGLVTTVIAGAMLVTGRRLHSRPVGHAILASAVLHLVLLCLATSDGLILGSRLWWLGSAIVLCLAWTGADVGATRGRGVRRGVWSATGGRMRVGGGGSGGVMPLFRAGSANSGATGMGKGAKIGERARYND